MITKSILSLILSLPFFKNFEISQEALNSLKSVVSYVNQIGSYVNLGLLVDTFVLFFVLLLFCFLASLIRAVI